jgi:hypothetical protein
MTVIALANHKLLIISKTAQGLGPLGGPGPCWPHGPAGCRPLVLVAENSSRCREFGNENYAHEGGSCRHCHARHRLVMGTADVDRCDSVNCDASQAALKGQTWVRELFESPAEGDRQVLAPNFQ